MDIFKSSALISVIIPMYNAEATITKALHSVLHQTVGRFEIIITNDGSTDESLLQVQSFKMAHPELPVIIVDKANEGVSSARNTSLRLASGSYIAFLDADDVWHSNKTEKQLAVMQKNPEVAFAGCLYEPEPIQRFLFKKFDQLTTIACTDLLFKNFFQTSTVIMKKEVFKKIGFFEKSRSYAEEVHYFLRVSKQFSCVLINENLINYGNGKRAFGQSGLSGNLTQMEIGELRNFVYAYRVLHLPLITCFGAAIFSLIKFCRRVCIVYTADIFKPQQYNAIKVENETGVVW